MLKRLLSQGVTIAIASLALMSHAEIVQDPASNSLVFQAESPDVVILNPDAANDVQNSEQTGNPESPERVWEEVSDAAASGGLALEAPPSPHRQMDDTSLHESIAAYSLRFVNAGTYYTYLRARNNGTPDNAATDSVWISSSWNQQNPDNNEGTSQTGEYGWRRASGSLTVGAGEVNTSLGFRIGVREYDTRIDGVVFSTDSGLSDAELDGLLVTPDPIDPINPIDPPPPPTNEPHCVSNLAELNAAIDAAVPGDTIYMCNGAWSDTFIDFDTDGAPGYPITLQASTPGQVLLTGSSRLEIAGDYLVVRGLHFTNGSASDGDHVIQFRGGSSDLANNSRLTECAITDFNPSSSSVNFKWVSIYGFNNRVDHCAFVGMDHVGVTLTIWLGTGAPANNTRIDNNYFADHASGGGDNGWETIRIGTSSRSMQDSDAIVESNLFYRCDGEIEIISNKSVGNIYRYNTFRECQGQLTLRHGNECIVQGNFFLGDNKSNSSGVRVIGEDHVVVNNYFENLRGTGYRAAVAMMNGIDGSPLNGYFQVQRALIAFNTFYGCRDNFVVGISGDGGDEAPLDCVIANNIVKGSEAPLIEYQTTPINMQYEGNIFHGASLGITQPSGITIVDPLLSPAADDLQRPTSPGSPALDNAAGSYADVVDDMDGDPRTGSKDIGADEVTTDAPVRGPLAAHDVGPRWMKDPQPEILDVSIEGASATLWFHDLTGLAARYAVDEASVLAPAGEWTEVTAYAPNPATSDVFLVATPATNAPLTVWRIRAE